MLRSGKLGRLYIFLFKTIEQCPFFKIIISLLTESSAWPKSSYLIMKLVIWYIMNDMSVL